jgi:protein-disulfide isomerase
MNTSFRERNSVLAFVLFVAMIIATAVPLQAVDPQTTAPPKPAPETAKKPEPKGSPTPGTAKTDFDKTNQRLIDIIQNAFTSRIPPNTEISVAGRTPSKLGGLDSVTLEFKNGANTNRLDILVTADNKFAVVGQILDLSKDPFAENVDKISMTNSPVFGNKNAKVTIVEYSDFQCPYCSQAYRTVEDDVMKQFGDKVKLVYKNFPLPGHAWAESAAIAGLCANRQSNDAFWVLYRSFFENQSEIKPENVKAKTLEYAAKAQIDTKKFEDCYDNKLTLPQVKAEMTEAQSLGITGTPLFVINGHPLSGVQPFSSFQKVIEDELKKNPN